MIEREIFMEKRKAELQQSQKTMQEHLMNILKDFSGWDDMKTTTDESLGRATITGKKDGLKLSLTIDRIDLEEVKDNFLKKSDYKDEVICLRQQGLKQQDIADRLGISQSLVSKLLKQK